jgi:hypothetical protein
MRRPRNERATQDASPVSGQAGAVGTAQETAMAATIKRRDMRAGMSTVVASPAR